MEKIISSRPICRLFTFIYISTDYQNNYDENKVSPFVELIYHQDSNLSRFFVQLIHYQDLRKRIGFEFEFESFVLFLFFFHFIHNSQSYASIKYFWIK